MTNRQALLDIIPVLHDLESIERFNMASWATGPVNPFAADYTDCATQFCLAGAKAAVDGWRPQYRLADSIYEAQYGNLMVATGKFVRPENRHVTDPHDPRSKDAEVIAKAAFGLADRDADFLFYATHVSRAADMERRIRWIADGNDRLDFPQRWIDEEYAHAQRDQEARFRAAAAGRRGLAV